MADTIKCIEFSLVSVTLVKQMGVHELCIGFPNCYQTWRPSLFGRSDRSGTADISEDQSTS